MKGILLTVSGTVAQWGGSYRLINCIGLLHEDVSSQNGPLLDHILKVTSVNCPLHQIKNQRLMNSNMSFRYLKILFPRSNHL